MTMNMINIDNPPKRHNVNKMRAERKNYFWIIFLVLIVVLGGFLRFYGLDWGLPWRYHVDENAFINAAHAMGKAPHYNYLNPEWFYHPSLNIYLVCLLSWFYSFFGNLTLPGVHLLGRINSAFWGTLSIPMIFLLGCRLYGKAAGILAALFLSVTVIHVQMSHFFTPDVTLVFFVTAVMYFSAGLMRTGRLRDYLLAGAAAGVGMASKYWAPAVVPILTAHIIRLIELKCFSWEENKKILLSLILAGLAFFIFSPYVILDAGSAVPKILWWAKKTTGAIPQIWAYHFEGTIPWLFLITDNIPWGLGLPLTVLSGIGFIFLLIRHRKKDILLAAWIIVNFSLIGSWYIKSIRYILPLVPFLLLAASGMIVAAFRRRYFRVAAIAALVFAFVWSGIFSLAFIQIYGVAHSKTRASEWIYKNIPSGSHIAGNHPVPLGPRNNLPDLFEEKQMNFTYLFESDLTPAEKESYLDEFLAESDYLVFSDAIWNYFQNARPRHYPEKEFLNELFTGRTDFELIKRFKVYPKLGEWIISDDGAELSFHYFDHPGIYVFKKKTGVME